MDNYHRRLPRAGACPAPLQGADCDAGRHLLLLGDHLLLLLLLLISGALGDVHYGGLRLQPGGRQLLCERLLLLEAGPFPLLLPRAGLLLQLPLLLPRPLLLQLLPAAKGNVRGQL